MYINEYGDRSKPKILMLHPMGISGRNLYEITTRYLKKEYYILSPDQGGHGKSGPYCSCKEEALPLEKWLVKEGLTDIKLLYGASMGTGTGYELLKNNRISFEKVWFDGGSMSKNAAFMNFFMKKMFLREYRALKKDFNALPGKFIRMYGEEFMEMMKYNLVNMEEADIINICNECSHREIHPLPAAVQKKIHFDYGSREFFFKDANKIIKKLFPYSALTVRKGYFHCGYMALNTEKYVRELEAYIGE